ncbi:excalibur calcium-binding domain-containing protein [Sphingobium yanoikuyae]|uniref:excalibur calcium-binding domain-containing protein n=1 Tax=Sphingobium yanoikuyae TaxID=13690 RepID=UPI002E11E154
MNRHHRQRTKSYRRKGSYPSVAIIGGAIMLGFVGGVGSALLPSSSSNTPVVEEEPWRQHDTVASQSYMSAADLDDQQPSVHARKAEPERLSTASTDSRSSWPYRNCAQARAAGAAPVYAGEPGYGPHLDRDGDGIGCEPYRGR